MSDTTLGHQRAWDCRALTGRAGLRGRLLMAILRAPPAKTTTATRRGTELAITGLEPTARPSRCRPNAIGTSPALPPPLRPPSGQQSASCLGARRQASASRPLIVIIRRPPGQDGVSRPRARRGCRARQRTCERHGRHRPYSVDRRAPAAGRRSPTTAGDGGPPRGSSAAHVVSGSSRPLDRRFGRRGGLRRRGRPGPRGGVAALRRGRRDPWEHRGHSPCDVGLPVRPARRRPARHRLRPRSWVPIERRTEVWRRRDTVPLSEARRARHRRGDPRRGPGCAGAGSCPVAPMAPRWSGSTDPAGSTR
jgi:hypothetical protein